MITVPAHHRIPSVKLDNLPAVANTIAGRQMRKNGVAKNTINEIRLKTMKALEKITQFAAGVAFYSQRCLSCTTVVGSWATQ